MLTVKNISIFGIQRFSGTARGLRNVGGFDMEALEGKAKRLTRMNWT
jgi:hypothetical protein